MTGVPESCFCRRGMRLRRASAILGIRLPGKVLAVIAAGVVVSAPLTSSVAHAATTVTTYQYNADGALTAVTTQVDGGDATTTYLTWDDFVPNEDDPTTGTVYAGNGNLLAIGPKPGSGSSLFAFDNRDRLTSFSGADKSSAYGYHADGLMASSTAADDSGFGFYYAGSDMANLHQTDTDQWSAQLGQVRYLDDGSEEVLLTPRKDVAATYDPSSNTLQSYDYDSFGAEADAPLSSSYDLKDNPHRYAGEYRDPLWGGYYLKARWYDPDLAIFLSRDPAAGFHPYSYSDGSPVMNVDPSGTSAQTSGHVTGETSVGSILFNVFVAPLVSMFTKEYWSDVIHNEDQAATFLAAGIVAEVAFFGLDTYAFSTAWRGLRTATRWSAQNVGDVGLNVGQAAVSATHGGQFSVNEFGQNLEGLPMGMFYSRGFAGFGRRAHTLRGTEVAKRIHQMYKDRETNVLIFRSKAAGFSGVRWRSPILESFGYRMYARNDEIFEAASNSLAHKRFRDMAGNPVQGSRKVGSGQFLQMGLDKMVETSRDNYVRLGSRTVDIAGSFFEPKYEFLGARPAYALKRRQQFLRDMAGARSVMTAPRGPSPKRRVAFDVRQTVSGLREDPSSRFAVFVR